MGLQLGGRALVRRGPPSSPAAGQAVKCVPVSAVRYLRNLKGAVSEVGGRMRLAVSRLSHARTLHTAISSNARLAFLPPCDADRPGPPITSTLRLPVKARRWAFSRLNVCASAALLPLLPLHTRLRSVL